MNTTANRNDGIPIIYLGETESTNAYLKNLLKAETLRKEEVAVMADYQTRGRGQMGNGWHSDKGENLLCSLLIYPSDIQAHEQFILSRVISLAIKRSLDRHTDGITIKWPNDIYWKERKIAGILIENNLMGYTIENSIIGFGLNINQKCFPAHLPNPVSLRQITGVRYNIREILFSIVDDFTCLRDKVLHGMARQVEEEYMLDLYHAKGGFWFEDANGRFQAEIEEVLPSGHLVLRTFRTKEKRLYAFKEVTFINETN